MTDNRSPYNNNISNNNNNNSHNNELSRLRLPEEKAASEQLLPKNGANDSKTPQPAIKFYAQRPVEPAARPAEEPKKKKRRDKSDLGEDFVAPDGGWGWLVAVASGVNIVSTANYIFHIFNESLNICKHFHFPAGDIRFGSTVWHPVPGPNGGSWNIQLPTDDHNQHTDSRLCIYGWEFYSQMAYTGKV